uniref:Uncharacterized protein n=2 Tax=Schizaphis graminum TaxID=13262 RepID=A0A2S2PW90_SCHGA
MNNRSYSILTKQIVNNFKHEKNFPENVFCSVCNVYMNRIKRSQILDTHQEQNEFLSDRTKECWHSIDCLQTLHNNLHQTVDHTSSSERQLKLNPYLILDTDPTLDNLNNSNSLYRYSHSLGTVPDIFFCSACNVQMNRIKISQTFDTHQEHNVFISDSTNECWRPIDRVQTLHNNIHKTVNNSSEGQLKLNPYLILDTDPTLNNLNYLNALYRYPHSLGK